MTADTPEAGEPKPRQRVRKISRRHPFLRDWPKGVFHPNAWEVVKGYPRTIEAWEKRRDVMKRNRERYIAEHGSIPSRRGVPDGWANRKQEVEDIRAHARAEAKDIVNTMVEKGLVSADEARANDALEFAVGIVRGGDVNPVRERLAAAGLVLKYTKAPPATKSEVTVNKAEDFLAALAVESRKG